MVTKLGITSIFVTHDQDEAVEVADEIIITNHGRIEQMGSPIDIYKSPATPFVVEFIGKASEVSDYSRLKGFDEVNGADRAFIRPEFVKYQSMESFSSTTVQQKKDMLKIYYSGAIIWMSQLISDVQE